MTDTNLPRTFEPDAGDDLASWPVTVDAATAAPTCPWCSAALPAPDVDTCPSCRANLVAEEEVQVPGVTAIDPLTALRTRSRARSRPRRDVLGWITGESALTPTYDDPMAEIPPTILPAGAVPLPALMTLRPSPGAVAPPDVRVRREMLRMELEAIGLELREDADEEADEEADEDADGPAEDADGPADTGSGSEVSDPSGPPGA